MAVAVRPASDAQRYPHIITSREQGTLGVNHPVIEYHRGDLPTGLDLGDVVAIDTETTGLRPHRDHLCLVQLCGGDGVAHLVHFPPEARREAVYAAPNLGALLRDPAVLKLFHFARFDIGMLHCYLNVTCRPVYCTKIASRLVRTYTDRHSLRELCRELLGIEISKEQQSSDWGAPELTAEQCRYAAGDVLHLHRLRTTLDQMIAREGRGELADACFRFVPDRALLDIKGWADEDIFAY